MTDLSQLSNEDLLTLPDEPNAPDLSQLSNEQLIALPDVSSTSNTSMPVKAVNPNITPTKPASNPLTELSSFASSLNNDLQQRGAHLADIKNRYDINGGGIGQGALAAFNTLGTEAGAAKDIIGDTGKAAYNAMPDLPFLSDNPKAAIKSAVASPVGQVGLHALQAGGKMWDNFKTSHPDIANFLEASGNIATMATPVGEGTIARTAADTGLGVAKTGANIAAAPMSYIADGVNTIGKGIKATGAEGLNTIEKGMKSVSSGLYDHMKDVGAEIKPEVLNAMTNDIKNTIKGDVGRLDPQLHKATISVLKGIDNMSADGELNLESLDQQRRLLSRISRTGEDSTAAQAAINVIDKHINSWGIDDLTKGTPDAISALNAARQQWTQAKKFETVSDIIKDAEDDSTKLKSGLNKLFKNDDAIANWSDEEKATLQDAAKSSYPEKALKAVGALGFNPAKHPYMALGEVGVLRATHNPALAGVIAAGTVANQLTKYMARGKAEQLVRILQAGGIPKELAQIPAEDAKSIMKVRPQLLLAAPRKEPITYGTRGASRLGTDATNSDLITPPPPRTLSLPPPEDASTLMVDRQNNIRPITAAERIAAQDARDKAIQTGLTPDVLNSQLVNQKNLSYATKAEQDAAKKELTLSRMQDLRNKADSIAKGLEGQNKPSVSDMMNFYKESADISNKPISNLGSALEAAIKKKNQ